MSTEPGTSAWIEVRGDLIRRNLERVREITGPGVRLCPMVKADAYGLGMRRAVESMRAVEPWGWGVATVAEGLELRRIEPERPILVFSPAPPGVIEAGLAGRLTFCVSDVSFLEALEERARALGVRAAVHVEVDTGMGRSGLAASEAADWSARVRELTTGALRWEGCFTHFHSADEDDDSWKEQTARFDAALARVVGGTDDLIVHLANSAGVLRGADAHRGMVRPGLFLYGGAGWEGLEAPEPVIALRARIGLVREVAPGTTVGYGATYRAGGCERWATAGIGYGDGIFRALAGRGRALVRGRSVPILGRISMDMTVVDITDVPGVKAGEVVTFIGSDGDKAITLTEFARAARTNEYEVLTGFGPRPVRCWIEAD